MNQRVTTLFNILLISHSIDSVKDMFKTKNMKSDEYFTADTVFNLMISDLLWFELKKALVSQMSFRSGCLTPTIRQASRILLMCCPWVSVIIGWITDVTGGKKTAMLSKSFFGFEF